MNATRDDLAGHLRRVVDRVPSMLAYWDRDLRCRFANRAYERWFGRDPDSLIGTSIADLLGPELFALNEPYIRGALRGQEQVFERVVPGPDGVRRHSLAHYLPDVVDGRVEGFTVQVTEVTRLKETEAALRTEMAERARTYELLRQNEAALREAQRLGQIGSWEWEVATDVTTWSDELYAIFGSDAARLPPPFAEQVTLYAPHSWYHLQQAVEHTVRSGEPYTLELEYRRPDGHTGWIEARGEAVRDASGEVSRLRGTVLDITVRRQMEEARLQRDLAEAASLNKTHFLSNVSHELRTPLNAILGFAQLFEIDPSIDEKRREWARHIRSSGQHMLDLVEEILDLSGTELGHVRVTCVTTHVDALARACLEQLAQLALQAGVELIDALPATPLAAHADPRRVRQVMHNLLSNAIKYSSQGAQVTLTGAMLGNEVQLQVRDTGIGMSEAQLQRLFTPFDRLGAEATNVQGTGIGLALSRRLVELMGGRIEAHSQPGTGSVFTLTLPAAPP